MAVVVEGAAAEVREAAEGMGLTRRQVLTQVELPLALPAIIAIAGGGGVNLFNSQGNAWTADYLKVTGELDVDLRSNIAAEARAKIIYERLINVTEDPGVKEALGPDADKAIAMASSFEVADPTVDSQILTLANTKADVFLIYSVTPRACAQAVRKAYETGWRPMRFISSVIETGRTSEGVASPNFGGSVSAKTTSCVGFLLLIF